MKNFIKKIIATALSILLICALFSGCSSAKTTESLDSGVLINFKADTFDIPVGEQREVKFTVQAEGESVGSVNLCLDNRTVGEMKDDGTNGDNISGDGIYTCVLSLKQDKRSNLDYYSTSGESKSNTFRVCFYSEITDEDYNSFAQIARELEDIKTYDEALSYFKNHSDYFESYYEDKEHNTIKYKTVYGISGSWMVLDTKTKGSTTSTDFEIPSNDGYYGGVISKIDGLNIGTYLSKRSVLVLRPFRNMGFEYDDFMYAGMAIAHASKGGVDVYDDNNADIDAFKSFGSYGCVLIDSHGDVDDEGNTLSMLTGEVLDSVNSKKYSADLNSERITVGGPSRLCVTPGFFNKYYPTNSLNDTVCFLGTCYSAYNNAFGDVLTTKGSPLVIGYSDSVSVDYCNDTLYHYMIENLTVGAAEASAAFDSTVAACGESDGNAALVMFKRGDEFNMFNSNYQTEEASEVTTFSTQADMSILLGEADVIEPEIEAADNAEYSIQWVSSNPSVASVNREGNIGVINAVSPGEAEITATLYSGSNRISRTTTVSVNTQERDVILVLDCSSSMTGEPFDEMKEVAQQFCDDIFSDNADNRIALVTYETYVNSYDFTSDYSEISADISNLYSYGTTNMRGAIEEAKEIMDNEGREKATKDIIIMTDGVPNEGEPSDSGSLSNQISSGDEYLDGYGNAAVDAAQSLSSDYNVYSLGFFHAIPLDYIDFVSTMLKLMTNTENGFYQVDEAENLSFAFGDIGETITDGSKVIMNIACPVDITVKSGNEELSSANGDAEASFGKVKLLGKNKDIKLFVLDSKNVYDVAFTGTGVGVMNYSVNYYDEDNNLYDYRDFSNVPLTETTQMVSNSDNSTPIELSIDSDGDGNYDDIWESGLNSSGSSLTQKKASVSVTRSNTARLKSWQIAIIVGSIALVGIFVLMLVTFASKKKAAEATADAAPSRPVNVPAVYPNTPVRPIASGRAEVKIPGRKDEAFRILSGQPVKIGKDTMWASVVLPSKMTKLSRRHCMIEYNEGSNCYFITDYSTNGTFIKNGKRLEKNKRERVSRGTTLVLGSTQCEIRLN